MITKGLLLPIAAPSGTGKTTVCRQLLEQDERFVFSISATTREPRKMERDGVDYYFLSREQFKAHIRQHKLAEYEQVFENYYGTLRSTLDETLAAGKILLLDIDVKGALAIKNLYPEQTISVFLLPPSQAELLRRLKGRDTEDEQSIAIRNARIPAEIKLAEQFDRQIVNDKLDHTVDAIMTIIKEYTKNDTNS
ncbi:guanylate kinase [bacterium]|nr:guanylate kinase [bacterium]MBU1633845.1 guanylate kinase [bacterium]MBU1872932.1 guanylate kinase [bacterium]